MKPPMATYLRACRPEVPSESWYYARAKTKINSDGLGPKIASEAISQHQIQQNFHGGAYPQTPLASARTRQHTHSGTTTGKPDQCNFASTGPVIMF